MKNSLKAISFLVLSFTLISIILLVSCVTTGKKVNIVLIVIDTLRPDHLPFYGYQKNTAPFLSEIANKGLIFENAYTTSSWTAPATASIFTSLYPFQHGVVTGFQATKRLEKVDPKITLNKIPAKIKTIAEILKDSGYKTFCVSDNFNVCKEMRFAQGFDHFRSHPYKGAELVNSELQDWETKIKDGNPYFLYIHYMDPHLPYHERSPWFKEPSKKKFRRKAAYDSEISYVDSKIEEMFNLFKWNKNTLLIVTSDHGEEFNEHGNNGHGKTLYSEVLHVPLLIYYPEFGFKNKRIAENVSVIDILPTIGEFVGLSPGNYEGKSLMPLFNSEKLSENKRYLYSHLHRRKGEFDKDVIKKSVILDNWKYIVTFPDYEELYNLAEDPNEKLNKMSENSDIAESMKYKLFDFERNCKKYTKETFEKTLDKDMLEKLKSLGYIK